MKAAKIISPRTISVVDEPIPPLQDGMVLVRLLYAAICGSDLPYFGNDYPASSYPLPSGYPGHECLGIVEQSGVDSFKPGDKVMYYPELYLLGFKEYHCTRPERLHKLPADGDDTVLLMTQLLGAVSHAVFRLEPAYNKTIVIVGQGPVGQLFTALMKNMAAKRVIAVDKLDYRLDVSKKMGADITLNPTKQDIQKSISELTGGAMADIVIDAYGQESSVINTCFELARHNGQVAFFGICLEENPRLNFNSIFRKELRLVASVGPDLSIDYPYALDLILRGAIDVRPIITHVLPFEKIQQGFEMALNRSDNAIKIILQF